jgi:RNA polymerase sigma-70 factor (ECF subfamily)
MSTELVKTAGSAESQRIRWEDVDRSLLERITRRDRLALRQLFERNYLRTRGFFSGLALESETAEELTVDTFLAAWDSAGSFDGHLPVSMWLLALSYQCALRSIGECTGHTDLGGGDQHDEYARVRFDALRRADLVHVLSCLPIRQRVALELTYRLGHSREEIAAIMGCSEVSVQRHVFFARRDLYALLAVSRRRNEAVGTEVDGNPRI